MNILFITSDQQRGDCFGFEGRRVRTPHLDQLATEGTRFSACITPNVVCQPSRASILTGLLPRRMVCGTTASTSTTASATPGSPEFGRAGYRTGFIGKAHFSTFHTFEPTGRPENRASTSKYGPDWYGPYMGFNHVELMVGGHNIHLPLPPDGQHYERWYHADGRGEAKNRLYSTHMPPDVGAAQTWHSGAAFRLAQFDLDRRPHDRLRPANKDEPFFLWASFPDPHHPFDAPEPWSRMHHPDDVDLPKFRTMDLERRPWWHRASLEFDAKLADGDLREFRERYSRTPTQTDEQLRHLIANYYGMISLIDHNVGRILIALDELGLRDDTIVVYTTDHGDWLGDHGIILKGPMMYEGLLRIGCLMRGHGIPAGNVVRDPVSTLDLPATYYDYAGIAPNSAMHSRSLRPLIEKGGYARLRLQRMGPPSLALRRRLGCAPSAPRRTSSPLETSPARASYTTLPTTPTKWTTVSTTRACTKPCSKRTRRTDREPAPRTRSSRCRRSAWPKA